MFYLINMNDTMNIDIDIDMNMYMNMSMTINMRLGSRRKRTFPFLHIVALHNTTQHNASQHNTTHWIAVMRLSHSINIVFLTSFLTRNISEKFISNSLNFVY